MSLATCGHNQEGKQMISLKVILLKERRVPGTILCLLAFLVLWIAATAVIWAAASGF